MDKKIFLFDKNMYDVETINALTEFECELWVSEADYDGDNSILKIDANGYDNFVTALDAEVVFLDQNDYYIKVFGFGNEQREVKTILDKDILFHFDIDETLKYLKGFKKQGYTSIYEDENGNIVASKIEKGV